MPLRVRRAGVAIPHPVPPSGGNPLITLFVRNVGLVEIGGASLGSQSDHKLLLICPCKITQGLAFEVCPIPSSRLRDGGERILSALDFSQLGQP
jgi:hypothetical protein